MKSEEYKVEQTVEEDGMLRISGLPVQRGDRVEVTVRVRHARKPKHGITAAELLASDFVGMWADREDMRDTLAYARSLRDEAQSRDWSDDDSTGQ